MGSSTFPLASPSMRAGMSSSPATTASRSLPPQVGQLGQRGRAVLRRASWRRRGWQRERLRHRPVQRAHPGVHEHRDLPPHLRLGSAGRHGGPRDLHFRVSGWNRGHRGRAVQLPLGRRRRCERECLRRRQQNARIQEFTNTGTFLTKWGSFGSGDGQFGSNSPTAVAVDASGDVFVADNGNNRVQKFACP